MGHGILDSLDITDTTTATTGGLGALVVQGGALIKDNLIIDGFGTKLEVPGGVINCSLYSGSGQWNQNATFSDFFFPSRIHRSRFVAEITDSTNVGDTVVYQIQTDPFASGGATPSISTLLGVELFGGPGNTLTPSTYIHLKTTTDPGIATNVFAAEFDNRVRITDTTASTSTTSGALIVAGGVGISGDLYANAISISDTTASTSTTTGALTLLGGLGVNSLSYISELRVSSNTNATSDTTGALVVTGGMGIGRDCKIGGTGAGALQVTGGSILAGPVQLTAFSSASSKTTGALVVTGGVGVSGDLYVSNATVDSLSILDTTASTSRSTGALTVGGGVGVLGDLFATNIDADLQMDSGSLRVGVIPAKRDVFLLRALEQDHQYLTDLTSMNTSFVRVNSVAFVSDFDVPANTYNVVIQERHEYVPRFSSDGSTIQNFYCLDLLSTENSVSTTTINRFAMLHTDTRSDKTPSANTFAAIFDEKVLIESTQDCTGSDTGALQCAGGLNVKKTAFFEENMAIRGTVGDIANFGLYVGAPPATTSLSNYGFLDNSGNTGFSAGFTANYSAFFEDRVRVGGILAVQSDGRLKRDIEDLKESNFMNILKMKPKKYHWKRQKKSEWHYGLIAQEVEALMPELVNYARTFVYLEDDIFGDKQHLTLPQDIIDENPGDEMRIQKVNEKDEVYGPHISIHLEPTKTPGTYKLKEAYRGRFKVIGYYLNDCRDINYIGLIPHIIQAMKVIFEKVSLLEEKGQGISKGVRDKKE